ncbi:MAG TPA: class I adenylate-forming enzyme family protein [Acidimicrobiia bacterium]|nr:class I adenylate-forming enzyme family protein [Acidimicrobiia bacterium]
MTLDVRVHDILARLATVSPTRVGATLGDEARTIGELDTGATRAAHRLAAAGVAVGDRVTWWGPTAFAALEVGYGTSKLGGAIAPINPNFTEPEAASALEVLHPRVVVAHPEFEDVARAVAEPLGLDVVVAAPGWSDGASTTSLPRVGSSEDPSNVFLTSGSTGVSKGAVLSHRAAWLRAVQRDVEEGRTQRRGSVVMFGLFHMAGWYFIENAMAADRAVHLVRGADPEELLHAIERWRAGGLYCIPAVWQRILECADRYDTSSLVEALTGTSLVTLELIDAIKEHFPGSWTSVAYGSTEMGRGLVLVDSDLYDHAESVGQPPPMVTTSVADDGELWLRGPTMFSGYLDRPDATAEAIDPDGWFHTGDLVTRDADGYFTITGRASESIRSGGEWVAPVEVESAVSSHPAVAEVAVVGIPDAAWGEVVTAAIVLEPGATLPTVDELRAHVAGVLVGPKQPRRVVQVDALPRTDATGQIRRRALRDALLAQG